MPIIGRLLPGRWVCCGKPLTAYRVDEFRRHSAFWPRCTADWLQHRSLLAATSQLHASRAMATATHRDVVSSHRFCTQIAHSCVSSELLLLCITAPTPLQCQRQLLQCRPGRVMWGPTVQTPVMISPSYPSSRMTFSRLGLPAVMRTRAAPTSADAMHRKITTVGGIVDACESSRQHVTAEEVLYR